MAEHIYLKTQVAVKVLHAHLAQGEFKGFLQEAQTIARLKHPHIIPIFDFGIDSTPFLVMDYLPQVSLRQRHPRGTIVPLSTIASYVNQIAAALQYAHDSRVIHRDVKPENMLINLNNQIVLGDFGIATTAHQTASLKTTDISGSPSYMSPEHIAGKPRAASDQYALGIVVYEWLCGMPPFTGEPMAIMYQQTYANIPPLQVEGKTDKYDDKLTKIVTQAISKDPQDRFSDVQAFADALKLQIFTELQFYAFEKRLDFINAARYIEETDLNKLIDDFQDILSPSEVISPITVPIISAIAIEKIVEQLDPTIPKKILDLLQIINMKTLYEAFQLPSVTATPELYRLTEELYKAVVRRMPKTAEVTALTELAGLAMEVFKTEDMRRQYDESLR